MKKNVLIFCLLGFVIAASAKVNPKGYYNMRLIGVDVSDGTKGEFRTERTRYGIDFSTYLDDEIEISLTVHPTHVSFELMNKTDEAIRVIWGEAKLAGFDGEWHPIVHRGITSRKKSNNQEPSVIVRKSTLTDFISPNDNFFYTALGNYTAVVNEFLIGGEKSDGKIIRCFIPIEINGEKRGYTFIFDSAFERVRGVKTRSTDGYYTSYREILR